MGIAQWTKQTIKSGSAFHRLYNIKPGDYLMMYDSYASEFVVKDCNQGIIVFRKRLNSPTDLALLIGHLHISQHIDPEIEKKLKRGGKSIGSQELHDHHIIPIHLWKDSKLVQAAVSNGFDMNGRENRMLLPKEFHKESHDPKSKYAEIVRYHLRDQWNDLSGLGLEVDPSEAQAVLQGLIEALREDLNELVDAGGSINDI